MSGFALATGTMLKCEMGLIPSPLNILPSNRVFASMMPVATMVNNTPVMNIATFGMCKSPANPQVVAIIASSLGSVTQAPCIPLTMTPWISQTMSSLSGSVPILTESDKIMCVWGGMISPIASSQHGLMVQK